MKNDSNPLHHTQRMAARLRETMGVPTRLAKVLLSFAEPMPGRTTVFLVREPLGV